MFTAVGNDDRNGFSLIQNFDVDLKKTSGHISRSRGLAKADMERQDMGSILENGISGI